MIQPLQPFYITTPIYYVNDSPHIGHAYTTIACDVMARFMRLSGREVFFLTGTDEHGQKVAKAAENAGKSPKALCDDVSQRFRNLVCTGENVLNISNDDFIRTTEPRHINAAQELWRRIEKNGYIYKANYGGWYAVRDEAYYAESELVEKEGRKIAPSGAEVEWVEEESYFFKLSEFQDRLLALYDTAKDFVLPKSRLNEVRSFVAGGLKDLSISRTTFNWGVPVPGDERHVMYVWIDALTNYLTAVGFADESKQQMLQKFWPEAVHVVGKDILRFHAVYWPAFLMAADLPVPQRVVAHGWWTIEGEKMSKSLGNVLSPQEMISAAGGVDQLRYFMLKAMPFGNDGDFSKERMIETINADLANNIGNLAQRTLSMIQKNCGGVVPESNPEIMVKSSKPFGHLLDGFNAAMMRFEYQDYLDGLLSFASDANEFIDKEAPWKLKKEDPKRMEHVLYALAEAIRAIAIGLQPFCPNAAGKILDQLAVPENERDMVHLQIKLKPGTPLPSPEGVFPRLQAEQKKDVA